MTNTKDTDNQNRGKGAWQPRHGVFGALAGEDAAPPQKNATRGIPDGFSIDDIVPPCPDCGRLASENDSNSDSGWRQEAMALHAKNPEATRIARMFRYLCADCQEQRLRARARREGEEHATHAFFMAYHDGFMPEAAQACTWDASRADIEARNVQAWQTARACTSESLWIYGNPGTGKTYMARCVANAALQKGHSVGELSALEIRTWVGIGSPEQIRFWTRPDVLLLDDIDKMPISDTTIGNLLTLLEKRISVNKKRIIVTSNLRGATLAEMWRASASPLLRAAISSIFERFLPITPICLEGGSNRVRKGQAVV